MRPGARKMRLDKKQATFDRDEEGKLIPVEGILEDMEGQPTILIMPVTRGEFQRITALASQDSSADHDSEMIKAHCLEPKLSEDDIKNLRPKHAEAIITAILATSLNVSQDKVRKTTIEKATELSEELLAKN